MLEWAGASSFHESFKRKVPHTLSDFLYSGFSVIDRISQLSSDPVSFYEIFFFLILFYTLKWAFPGGSDGKESACNAGDLGSIPGLGRSPGEGIGYPLQYSSILAWRIPRAVHGVAKSQT